jgi:hypothetical protein
MDEANQEEKKPHKERRFSQEQCEMLMRCSEKKDMSEWNKMLANNLGTDIFLEGAKFERAYLEGVNFLGAHLEGAKFVRSHLQGGDFTVAHLGGAGFQHAHLEGAELYQARIEGADFSGAIVDDSTWIWECKIDRKTDFRGVGLNMARIDSGTKQLLEYNIRRMNWEDWYKGTVKHRDFWYSNFGKSNWRKIVTSVREGLTFPIRVFWWMSDYGRSTGRIVLTFFVLAIVFALVYWMWPSCVMVNGKVGDIRGFVHALYFSVVTMTTLGFGDIAANPDSWVGQVILMVQVILGYVLLGALVTRFAVLFTAGGPARKFSK